ncbi:hypothetical protein VTN77DRAFT_5958 [Rasamsonia byssochlamydoides]|uniref:uncharacterized protein n=1 Tax=Rasamsonia byssochlamydoides TaxID=89139 RepID=UPI003743CB06
MTATTESEQPHDKQQSATATAKNGSLWQDLGALGGLLLYGLRNPCEVYTGTGPTLNELTCGLAGSSFNPRRDIGDLTGKVIFVTGGNIGLGKETILQLAHHRPHRIYLAARSESKARDAIASIQAAVSSSSPVDIRYIPLDLASFASIKNAASQFMAECERLDILILNAGIMGSPPQTTEAGHEIQFGTNHVGHFLLTKLLLPTLLKTATDAKADVRVVTVASIAAGVAPTSFDELTSTPSLLAASTWQRYGASKAANILFAAELARRHPEIISVSVHPGVVASNLYETTKSSNPFARHVLTLSAPLAMRNVSSGALNQLWAAAGASREELINGAFYTPVGNGQLRNRFASDAELARRLWEWTEEEVQKALW